MEKIYVYNDQETNYIITSEGKVFNRKTGRELKGTYARNEYHSVQLTIEGKIKSFMTHRLVAEMFCENPNNYKIVDHIDRNKYNNNYTNLRWVDDSTNMKNKDLIKIDNKSNYLKDFKKEEWKQYKDTNYWVNKKGQIINKKTLRILKPSSRNGYLRVSLPNGKKISLHIIIWEAFNGEIPEKSKIDHIDGNRQNNKLENLRLVTQSENMLNTMKNGHNCQVIINQYDLKGNFIKQYSSIRSAAIENNLSEVAIKDASNRHGTSGKYIWIRKNDDITIDEVMREIAKKKIKKTYIGVTQYSLEGKKIAHYDSLGAAARAVNSVSSTIKRAADSYRPGVGYFWILDTQNIEDFNIKALKTL